MHGAGQGINDFYSIRNGGNNNKFTPKIAAELHYKDKAWLKLMIEQNRHKDIVVMTHFMPSYACVNAKWKSNPGTDLLNHYFAANCDDLLQLVNPGTLWINGHTHDAYDMELGNARVVCNPLGYPGEHKYAFAQKVIEI
jgi:Icc-related predicted phosphoesterase